MFGINPLLYQVFYYTTYLGNILVLIYFTILDSLQKDNFFRFLLPFYWDLRKIQIWKCLPNIFFIISYNAIRRYYYHFKNYVDSMKTISILYTRGSNQWSGMWYENVRCKAMTFLWVPGKTIEVHRNRYYTKGNRKIAVIRIKCLQWSTKNDRWVWPI